MLGLLTCSLLMVAQVPAAPALPAPFTAAQYRKHVAYLASDELEGRNIGSEGAAKAMKYIIRHFQEAGLKGLGSTDTWYQDFPFGKTKQITARNVLGVFRGKGPLADEAVIVSTHHDHLGVDPALVKAGKDGIFNGADDNASGCAALLLVLQALSAERDRLPASHRSVLFISFDAEERGLIGSRYYVSQPLWPLNKTTADINFDQVGRLFRQKVMAADSASSAFFTERITALAAQCGLGVETRVNGAARADNASFLAQAIPAVHFSSGLHADYHQVTDEVDKIDSAGGARISWLAFRLLREVMDNPQHLRFQRPPPEFDVQGIIRLAFRLGIIPEQNAQAGKYPLIRFVIPNSLAAKQGFKANDEITSISGKKFDNIIDAALLFGQLRPDRDMKLTVLRQGQTIEITLPAEALKEFTGPGIRPIGNDQFEVLFRFNPGKKADSVTLAGTFNNWDVKALPMNGPDQEGVYTVKQTLRRGIYEYKFVVNGTEWFADRTNLRTTGTIGNSVLTLGND